MCVSTDRDAKGSSQSEVGDLDGPLVVYEQVLRLKVAVDDPAHVHEHNALQNLVRVAL